MAHIRQSRADSGLGFQAKVLNTVQVVPSSLGSGCPETLGGARTGASGEHQYKSRILSPARENIAMWAAAHPSLSLSFSLSLALSLALSFSLSLSHTHSRTGKSFLMCAIVAALRVRHPGEGFAPPQNPKPSAPNLKKHGCIHKAAAATVADFEAWYQEQVSSGVVYDFQKELTEYCISDVKILTRSLELFRDDMKDQNSDIDPLQSIIIAGYCLSVYLILHAPTEGELDEKEASNTDQTALAVLKKTEYEDMKRGFHGGRTEVFQLYKEWTDTDIAKGIFGRYIDIVSLYPT